MQRGDDFTPIEVLWVQRGVDNFYFAFGGCHRWEAHKRLNRPTIKAKLVKTTVYISWARPVCMTLLNHASLQQSQSLESARHVHELACHAVSADQGIGQGSLHFNRTNL